MPEKTYKIGEAAELLNLKSYVLRFWETEFPQLNPLRTESGQRLYSEQDLALLQRIRHLLHERGLTIEGARKMLTDMPRPDEELSSSMLDRGYSDYVGESDEGAEAAPDSAAANAGETLRLQTAHESELLHLKNAHADDLRSLQAKQESELLRLQATHESELLHLQTGHEDELLRLQNSLEQAGAAVKHQDAMLRQVLADLTGLGADLSQFSGKFST